MSRAPFDPMKSAAMRAAPARGKVPAPVPSPLPPEQPLLLEPHAVSPEMEFLAGSPTRPLTVGQINSFLSQTLDVVLPPEFFVQGEISNFRTYDRGHAFFTLKDAAAEMSCVIWKEALGRLKFKPKDGLAVIVRGAVRLYEQQGRLQLYVETIYPQGAGALELAFRQLCEKLRAEGLFEAARKRPIPRLPRDVVIITSRTGDVLHDVLTTAWRRYPGLHVMLYPVRVQGAKAAPEIIRAIQRVNEAVKKGALQADLMLLVRGGGSLEDLWAFNEESLARAIVASRIPIATGIGHEPDTTIADLVGDLRGPTPTGVTELTIPDARSLGVEITAKAVLLTRDVRRAVSTAQSDLEHVARELKIAAGEAVRMREKKLDLLGRQIERIEPRHAIAQGWRRVEEAQRRLEKAARQRVRTGLERVNEAGNRLERGLPRNTVERLRDRVMHLQARLGVAARARVAGGGQKVAAAAAQLRAVSPAAILERGFSITSDKEGNVVRSAGQVKRGDVLTTKVADGTIHSTVGKPRQESLF